MVKFNSSSCSLYSKFCFWPKTYTFSKGRLHSFPKTDPKRNTVKANEAIHERSQTRSHYEHTNKQNHIHVTNFNINIKSNGAKHFQPISFINVAYNGLLLTRDQSGVFLFFYFTKPGG